MPRKRRNARDRDFCRKIKAKPNFQVEASIPTKPFKRQGEIDRPGWIVAEGYFQEFYENQEVGICK